MIAPAAGLSVIRQCALLGIARSSFYYRPRPESAEELEVLQRLDRIFTRLPVYGSRRLQVALLREGTSIGRRRVRRLMRKLGLWAVRPKRNTSKPHPEHKIYPYLLRGKTIDQPNQVWSADITYIPNDLQGHATHLGRLGPAGSIIDRRQRQKPPHHSLNSHARREIWVDNKKSSQKRSRTPALITSGSRFTLATALAGPVEVGASPLAVGHSQIFLASKNNPHRLPINTSEPNCSTGPSALLTLKLVIAPSRVPNTM
jgi:HTH-like domain